jgi:hypothetical protein
MSDKDDHETYCTRYIYQGRICIDPRRDLPIYPLWDPERHVIKPKPWHKRMWNRIKGAWSLLLRGDDYHE